MQFEDVEEIVEKGESEKIEFKKSSANLKSAAETLCAFLNNHGGIVLMGVSDNKKIIGQDITDQTKQEIANTLRKFEPTANIEVQYINCIGKKQLIVLTAHSDSRSIPYTFDGKAYERKESTTNQMSQNRYQQLLLARNMKPISWESQPAYGFSIDDLERDEIINTLNNIISKNRLEKAISHNNVPEILTRLRLIESGVLTNAAIVLFAKEIPGDFLQCVIRMARFRGTEKGQFIDSKHIFGNAFQILREAELFISRNTAISSHFKKGEFERIDIPEYPVEAVREALINAICHRDYASLGGSITMTIYDDRLEIANTGLLPPDITTADLRIAHTSHPRNPRITNVFFRRGFIESMGVGTEQIIKSYTIDNMKEPEFYEQAGAFVVRLWSRHFKLGAVVSGIPSRQQRILELLKDNALAPKDILTLLKEDITDRTLRNELQLLKQKGLIQSTGHGKQTKWSQIINSETDPKPVNELGNEPGKNPETRK